ncbi:hypothetical protein Ssi03_55960 [Sphaerisporangium siamense]|uniref:Chitin-binding type-3 domain-containing protein n=1 Tax=Sphaerisporangium siamense TaxID=795645 RepID=A0A7W7DBB0_9ACTN|nr:hypothetical protein [Sphaerisporangium siamense]MBB4703399.1 hypothetical protein [Sphaerisporangium siamense]GII87606.1 hypothetical protein Ssi03_55960 [Sphaerisporangium siamense]
MRRAITVIGVAAAVFSVVLPMSAAGAWSAVPAQARSGAAADLPDGWTCYRQGEIAYFGGLPYRARIGFCGSGLDPATVPALWEPA